MIARMTSVPLLSVTCTVTGNEPAFVTALSAIVQVPLRSVFAILMYSTFMRGDPSQMAGKRNLKGRAANQLTEIAHCDSVYAVNMVPHRPAVFHCHLAVPGLSSTNRGLIVLK